jgi:phosphoglycerate dehydrogenase-like enzyme
LPQFRLGITGDFLSEQGTDACGGLPLDRLSADPNIAWDFIRAHAPRPGDAAYWQQFYSLEVLPEQLANLDGIIILRPWLKKLALEAARERLLVVGRSGAGYDKIDVVACTDCDVVLFNAPHALNHATASTALLFILALSKRLLLQDQVTRAGRWDRQAEVLAAEIRGRTLGIVGLGNSGRELVRLVAPFAMKVIAFSPHADPAVARELGVELVELEDLLRQSDFVSVHARPRPENRLMFGQAQFDLMKRTAFFVNVARGELVDERALIAVLEAGRIAGAALDVFEQEPLPSDSPLTRLENVILTPHWSASTRDVWEATGEAMVSGILRTARGELPDNIVNPEVLERPGFRAKLARFTANR